MKRLIFLLALMMLAVGCQKTQLSESSQPIEIELDYNSIYLKFEPDGSNTDNVVLYSKITPEGYDFIIPIQQGNGGYTLTQIEFTINHFPDTSITTEAKIVEDNAVVITFKGLLPENETKDNTDSFMCIDGYRLTDSEGKVKYINIWCEYFLPGLSL